MNFIYGNVSMQGSFIYGNVIMQGSFADMQIHFGLKLLPGPGRRSTSFKSK